MTLRLALIADDEAIQLKSIVVFRGNGKRRMKSSEVKRWELGPRVSVLSGETWVDTNVMHKIVDLHNVHPTFADRDARWLAFSDNLDAHTDVGVLSKLNKFADVNFSVEQHRSAAAC